MENEIILRQGKFIVRHWPERFYHPYTIENSPQYRRRVEYFAATLAEAKKWLDRYGR